MSIPLCILTKGILRGREFALGHSDLIEDRDSSADSKNRGIAGAPTSVFAQKSPVGNLPARDPRHACSSAMVFRYLRSETTPWKVSEMRLSKLRWTALLTLFCIFACGCSYFQEAASDDEIDLTEMDEEEEKPEQGEFTRLAMTKEPAAATPVEPVNEVKLKAGDRFPFQKSVEHRLTQVDRDGTHVSTSRADILLTLTVDAVSPDGRKLLTVDFQRVQYSQDMLGKKITYSSDEPTDAVPQEALLYSGLAGNGFTFTLGANNKPMDVSGYAEFLRRCLKNVPDASKAAFASQLDASRGADGIINFIDESIGLLPLGGGPKKGGASVVKGDFWELEPRSTDSPVPLITNSRCIMKDVSPDSAEILLTGRISGSPNPVTMTDSDGDLKVLVKGGNCTGSCKVHAQTGIPIQSQIQRSFELVFELPDGQKIQQNKDTVTRFSLVSESTRPTLSGVDGVRQGVFQNDQIPEAGRRIVPTGLSRKN